MRKKYLSLIIVLCVIATQIGFTNPQPFDSLVPKLTPLKTDDANATTLKGAAKGQVLVESAVFSDVSKIYGDAAIGKMAALGVIHEMGIRKYRPAAMATGYEALAQLTFLSGAEDAIMARVYGQTGKATTLEMQKKLLNQEVLAEAQTRGIVTNEEVLGLKNAVTKEQLAVWTARAIGRQPVNTQRTTFSFSDWASVNPTYRALIETLVDDGIVPLTNAGTFGPKNTVSRAELAVIMANALETQYTQRGIVPNFGLVVADRVNTQTTNGNTVNSRTLTVKNADGTVTNLVTEAHSKGNRRLDFVTYKKGVTSGSKQLAIGDEIEYYTKNNELVYAKVAENHEILDKIHATAEADVYNRFQFGKIADVRSKTEAINGKKIITSIYRVVDVSGDVFDIEVAQDVYSGKKDDILTYKDGRVTGTSVLKTDDVIQYLVTEKREVVYIKLTGPDYKRISGTIREITPITENAPATVTVFGYDDKLYTLPLLPYANLTINDRLAKITDYVYGMPVDISMSTGMVLTMNGTSYDSDPGYIPKYGKMRIGDVASVYKKSFTVTLPGGTKEYYEITPKTTFIKEGVPVSPLSLKVGLPVKLYFDDISSNQVSRVEIETPEIMFEIIYKGKLDKVSGAKGEINLIGVDGLSKPEFIANNTWKPAESFNVGLKINSKTDIYVGNEKLTAKELERSYSGYPVYSVVKSVYGKPTVVKMTVMTGADNIPQQSMVRRVDNTLGSFELSLSKENFTMNEGTIVIKDGLVVPNNNISLRDNLFVVSESIGRYQKNAMVVKVMTPSDTIFDRIKIGAIEKVEPVDRVTLNNHAHYSNNYITAVNKNESGYYKFLSNSFIQDVTNSADIKTIKPEDFFHKPYSRVENIDKTYNLNFRGLQYKRYYTYMVVNEAGDAIIAMKLRHKGLLSGQNFDDNLYKEEEIATELEKTFKNAVLTRGIVNGKDTTWTRVELTDSHDWTDFNGQWSPNRANIYVKYNDAIIIKNNKVITIDDVKTGDYLYIMRIKDQGMVIFVE